MTWRDPDVAEIAEAATMLAAAVDRHGAAATDRRTADGIAYTLGRVAALLDVAAAMPDERAEGMVREARAAIAALLGWGAGIAAGGRIGGGS